MKFSIENKRDPVKILRAIQVILAILVLALCAAAISGTNSLFSYRQFYYGVDALGIAVAILTLIFIPLTFFGFFTRPVSPWNYILLSSQIVLMVLWFSTFIALAVIHGPTTCRGFSPDFCACGKAAAAMAAVCWAAFAAVTYFVVREFMKERRGIYGPGGANNGIPTTAAGVVATDVERDATGTDEVPMSEIATDEPKHDHTAVLPTATDSPPARLDPVTVNPYSGHTTSGTMSSSYGGGGSSSNDNTSSSNDNNNSSSNDNNTSTNF